MFSQVLVFWRVFFIDFLSSGSALRKRIWIQQAESAEIAENLLRVN